MLCSVIKESLAAIVGKTDCKTKYRWRSVDALLTLIFRLCLGAWVCLFCTSRRLIRRKWTVTYQCQYFTINSSISECDHKYETRNAEPEIGTGRSSRTWQSPRVNGYGSGFGPPWVSGSGFGRFWNRTDPSLRSKPGPLADYPDPLLTLDVKPWWDSTLELLHCAYRVWEFTREWLQNPTYAEYRPRFTTPDEWTIAMSDMEVLRPFRYWTLWILKRHTLTLHHIITVYNDMFDHMDGVMRALAKKKTHVMEAMFFAVKLAPQELS